MVDDLKLRLRSLNTAMINDSWTHPRTLVLLVLLAKWYNFIHFLEIGAWKGAVPIMIKSIEQWFGQDQFSRFTLIENFEDFHANDPLANPESLSNHIAQQLPMPTNLEIFRIIKTPDQVIDAVHFDSAKFQFMLIDQFNALFKYCSKQCVFVFDDYIAEWPDVIYCVDQIIEMHGLAVVASFGPKIYVANSSLKHNIIDTVRKNNMESIFSIRHSIKHGEIVSSGPDLMI